MRPIRLLLFSLISGLAGYASAQTVLRWSVDPARPAAADWPVYQGETIHLEPAFASYGTALAVSNYTPTLYWQTNGMGSAWWSKPGVSLTSGRVRCIFAPTNDAGAAAYSYVIGLANTGLSYRAFGTLTMRIAPGAIPTVQPAPTTVADMILSVAGSAQTVSNALAAALQAEANARISGDAAASTNRQAAIDAEAGLRAAGDAALLGSNTAARAATAVHAARTDNPHTVTAAQVGAWTAAASAASNAAARASTAALALGDTLRTIQPGATNWVAVASGTATLYRVTESINTNAVRFVTAGISGASGQSIPAGTYTLYGSWHDDAGRYWMATNAVGWTWGDGAWGWSIDDATYPGRWYGRANALDLADGEWAVSADGHLVLPATATLAFGSGSGSASLDFLRTVTTNAYPLARLADLPSIAGLVSAADLAAVSNVLAAASYTKSAADARYLSSTPGWFWQGSQVMAATGALVSVAFSGGAYQSGAAWVLSPSTNAWHSRTGRVTITASRYLVGVSGTFVSAPITDAATVRAAMYTTSLRTGSNTWVLTSAPADGGNGLYYTVVSNAVAQVYDRADMSPLVYTNDAAGIIARVDALPGSGADVATDPRRAVSAGSLAAYVDSRKTEIADAAWDRTPGGRDVPDRRLVTIDEPLVQQGAIAYLQSGDYYCMSYAGGDWYSSPTGSVWRIGPSGRAAFEIAATNRMLHVQSLSVSSGYATIDISTNWVVGTPSIEFTDNLLNPQWLTCPAQTMTDHTSYWRGVCPGSVTQRFFRVISPGGENVIRSHYRHEFLDGVTLFGVTYTSLAELKAALEALP